jgi:hypothetical protein
LKRLGRTLELVGETDAAGCGDDPYETLIPDGEYEVTFVSAEKFPSFNRWVWASRFVVVDGPYAGSHLYLFMNVPKIRAGRTPSASISIAYEVATGRKSPPKVARIKPQTFLKDCTFRAAVRVVKKDRTGRTRSECARHSVIDHLVDRVAGTPPCIRVGGRPAKSRTTAASLTSSVSGSS